MTTRFVYHIRRCYRSCYLTNNILGAVTADTRLETDEQNETDEVPDLPRLPATFLAHHAAKGIGAPVNEYSAKLGAICTSVTAQPVVSSTRSQDWRSAGSFVSFRM